MSLGHSGTYGASAELASAASLNLKVSLRRNRPLRGLSCHPFNAQTVLAACHLLAQASGAARGNGVVGVISSPLTLLFQLD